MKLRRVYKHFNCVCDGCGKTINASINVVITDDDRAQSNYYCVFCAPIDDKNKVLQ